MAVRLSQIKGETRTVRIDFGDEGDLNITFRPGGITPAREEELQVEEAEGRGLRALIGLLCEVIVEWDLLDENGAPFPLDVEALMQSIPADLFQQVFLAIGEAAAPGEPSAGS